MTDRFRAILVGDQEVVITPGDQTIAFLARIIQREGSSTFIVQGRNEEYDSLEAAQAAADRSADDNLKVTTMWRDSVAPLPDEQGCFLCGCTLGVPLESAKRYPKRLCDVCSLELVDRDGARVEFFNDASGRGVRGRYVESEAAYLQTDCYARGVHCRAEEAYFGGIVVRPVGD